MERRIFVRSVDNTVTLAEIRISFADAQTPLTIATVINPNDGSVSLGFTYRHPMDVDNQEIAEKNAVQRACVIKPSYGLVSDNWAKRKWLRNIYSLYRLERRTKNAERKHYFTDSNGEQV